MRKSTEMIKEGLHFATVQKIDKGASVQTPKGKRERMWVTFLSRDQLSLRASILLYSNNRLLKQLKSATVGKVDRRVHVDEMIGVEVVIDVEHVFTGVSYHANVIGVYDRNDYDEGPDEDDDE